MRSLESFLTEPERSRGRHVRGEPMSSLSNSNSGLELAWYAPLNGNGKRAAPELGTTTTMTTRMSLLAELLC